MCKGLALLAAGLALSGCAWAGDRLRDLGDVFRAEASIGVGAEVRVHAGELVHVGAGSSRGHTAGWEYGRGVSGERTSDYPPLSLIQSLVEPNKEALHREDFGAGPDRHDHRCFLGLPGEVYRGDVERPPVLYWNIEIGFTALIVGVDLGFSLGEFVDFLAGFAGLDLGEDDASAGRRNTKPYWVRPDPMDRWDR